MTGREPADGTDGTSATGSSGGTDGPGTVDLAGARMARRLTVPFARGADLLDLVLVPGADGAARVAAYDFGEHRARFGREPEPAYVLRALCDLPDPTEVTVELASGSGPAPAAVRLALPGGTLAGESFVVPVPPDGARIAGLRADPAPGGRPVERAWSVTALLGTTAKLLWALGRERDVLWRQAARTAGQRRLAGATGASLDLIGADLAVPRFPPLPYGFDADTVALYRLDDRPGAEPPVVDATAVFPGRTGHHGTLSGGAVPGAPGRHGTALALTDAAAVVTVAGAPEFDVPADRGFTVECFVRPSPADGSTGADGGRVLGRGAAAGPGWALETGEFGRGLPGSVRAWIADAGGVRAEVFGDRSLPLDRFTHLAAVLDRSAGTWTLYLDGRPVAAARTTGLGAVAPTAPVLIGPGGSGFRGTVDEVRISSVARSGFAPALGESDAHYRRRLALFRRWTLPTPDRLAALLNGTVGPLGGYPDPLVVDDSDVPLVRGVATVRVVPVALRSGESVDAEGRRDTTEAELYGADPDEDFDAALLTRYVRPGVAHDPPPPREPVPGEPAPDPRLTQPPVAVALDALVALAETEAGPGGLVVAGGFDPRAADARAAGRAVLLRHPRIAPGRLAALAHRAGFDWTRALPRGGPVYASRAPGGLLAFTVTPERVVVGTPVTVARASGGVPLPTGTETAFRVVPHGPGRAAVTDGTDGTARLLPLAPGRVTVLVDLTRAGRTVSGGVTVRIGVAAVPDGGWLAADGSTDAVGPEAVVGAPEPALDPVFLVRHDDPRVDYGESEGNRRMQRGTAVALDALLDRVGGTLTVVAAYRPATGPPDLASRGRELTVRHQTLSAGELAAAAYDAGFGLVRRTGAEVRLWHPSAPLLAVRGPAELAEGATAGYTVLPGPAESGERTRLGWSSGAVPGGQGRAGVSSTTRPTVLLTGRSAGRVWLQAVFRDVDARGPYQVEVRLRPELVATGTVLGREEYDLIMNALHSLHPVGVEFVTAGLRAAVVELRDGGDADPAHTYPKFRLHRSAARLRKGSP
ncbi:LamG-like jellyroll fold domain-containing protein [Streptomyces sp. JNUCC 64]